MGRKAESPPSEFWARLVEAFAEQDLPTSQLGVAKKIGVSQGAVWRWYHGEAMPNFEMCRELAIIGGVTVEWLLTGRDAKYPISKDPVLKRIVAIWNGLNRDARKEVLKTAQEQVRNAGPAVQARLKR